MSAMSTTPLRYIDLSASVNAPSFTVSSLPILSYHSPQPLLPSVSCPALFTATAELPPLPVTTEDSSPVPSSSLPNVDCPSAEGDIVPLSCHLTYNPNVLKRKRTHGFLARKNKKTGRRVLMRRLGKGRKRMAA